MRDEVSNRKVGGNMEQNSIKLEGKILERLLKIAAYTNKSEYIIAQEAIENFLEDLEDVRDAEKAIKDIGDGKMKPISLEDLQKIYGLEQTENDDGSKVDKSSISNPDILGQEFSLKSLRKGYGYCEHKR
jgi:predicted DNA-binding protein